MTETDFKKIKSNLHYTRLIVIVITFRVSQVSGAQHLRGFAPGPTLRGYNGGESLATCRRFEPPIFTTRGRRLTTWAIWSVWNWLELFKYQSFRWNKIQTEAASVIELTIQDCFEDISHLFFECILVMTYHNTVCSTKP